jgi:hypothetical protein
MVDCCRVDLNSSVFPAFWKTPQDLQSAPLARTRGLGQVHCGYAATENTTFHEANLASRTNH